MKFKKLAVFVAVAIILTACGKKGNGENMKKDEKPQTKTEEKAEIHVQAAASLTDAMDEIIKNYKSSHEGVEILANYGGSGALQTQIENGAPASIFFSAATKQMDALQEKGLMDDASRVDLLKNEVVLIKKIGTSVKVKDFNDIANDTVKTIAIADPASVPVGQYSEEIFTNLGNWEDVKAKMVQSQDVRQTLDWVATGNADVGTVYKTDAMIEKDKVEIIATAPEGSHKQVLYPVAMTKEGTKSEAVKEFFEYLKSDEAVKVLENYGFSKNAN